MTQPLGLDAFPVTEDEAVELVVHHLKLAAMFFANTPEDKGRQLNEELRRQFAPGRWIGFEEGYLNACSIWVAELVAIYERDKEENGE